jgi:hypothetical protein
LKERRRTPAVARSFLALLPLVAGAAARVREPFAVAGPAVRADAPGDEITEAWPDGSPRRRYKLDPDGRLQGDYQEWRESGKSAVRTWYEHGAIDGAYASFHENGAKHVVTRYARGKLQGSFVETGADGKPLVEANYADGALDGKRTLWRDGAVASRQVWKRGELAELSGVVAHPRPLERIRAELAEIRAQTPAKPAPATAPDAAAKSKKEKDKGRGGRVAAPLKLAVPAGYAPADDPLHETRFAALKRLQEFRLLANVPWRDVALVPAYDHDCDAACRLLEAVGHLDHTPPNPGVPDDEYRAGYRGTSHSNLCSGGDLLRSIDSYMFDSDPTNVDRVGHRRHCLHPQTQFIGFGRSDHFTAMWALDRSRPPEKRPPASSWPPAGWMSASHLRPGAAWHCTFVERPNGAAGLDASPLRVFEMDADYVPARTPLELDYHGADGDAVIFRPVLTGDLAGRRFWVEVDEPDKSPAARYLVEFAPADAF